MQNFPRILQNIFNAFFSKIFIKSQAKVRKILKKVKKTLVKSQEKSRKIPKLDLWQTCITIGKSKTKAFLRSKKLALYFQKNL